MIASLKLPLYAQKHQSWSLSPFRGLYPYAHTHTAPNLIQKIHSANILSSCHQEPSWSRWHEELSTVMPILSPQGMQMILLITFCWLVSFANGGVASASILYPCSVALLASLAFFQAELGANDKLLLRKWIFFLNSVLHGNSWPIFTAVMWLFCSWLILSNSFPSVEKGFYLKSSQRVGSTN